MKSVSDRSPSCSHPFNTLQSRTMANYYLAADQHNSQSDGPKIEESTDVGLTKRTQLWRPFPEEIISWNPFPIHTRRQFNDLQETLLCSNEKYQQLVSLDSFKYLIQTATNWYRIVLIFHRSPSSGVTIRLINNICSSTGSVEAVSETLPGLDSDRRSPR